MNPALDFSQKLASAYADACKPLCRELGLPRTAFDILMFLGNNPEYTTARDIVEVRHIKANLVSIHVERLAQEGLLARQSIPGDRRKTRLTCTQKALPILRRGRKMQDAFFADLFRGVSEDDRRGFAAALSIMNDNLEHTLKGEL